MSDFTKKLIKRVGAGILSLSAAGLVAITQYEGFSDKVYIPVKGDVPTAGYGHADKNLNVGDSITKEQALEWLSEDIKEAEQAVKSCVKVPISQQEFDAYVSFAYNVGQRNFCTSTLVKLLNEGRYEDACLQLKRWIYSGGIAYQGLVNRREMETLTCTKGIYPNTK